MLIRLQLLMADVLIVIWLHLAGLDLPFLTVSSLIFLVSLILQLVLSCMSIVFFFFFPFNITHSGRLLSSRCNIVCTQYLGFFFLGSFYFLLHMSSFVLNLISIFLLITNDSIFIMKYVDIIKFNFYYDRC